MKLYSLDRGHSFIHVRQKEINSYGCIGAGYKSLVARRLALISDLVLLKLPDKSGSMDKMMHEIRRKYEPL